MLNETQSSPIIRDQPPVSVEKESANHMIQLDGLRALAIAAVAWSHWAPPQFQFGIPWGTGVQLFFVLSGFLITGILIRNREQKNPMRVWRQFYARRFLRIFPLFYLTIAVTLLLNVWPIRDTWPWHVTYLSNFFNVVELDPRIDPFRHFWSLAVEEQFYLVWPFLALLLPLRRLGWLLVGLVIATPFVRMAMVFFVPDHDRIHFLSWSSFDALGIGSLLAYLIHGPIKAASASKVIRWSAEKVARLGLIVGIPICFAGVALEKISGPSYPIHSIAHTGLILFYGWIVLVAAKGFRGWIGIILSNRLLVYLGKISYGLYVFHHFAPLLSRPLAKQLELPTHGPEAFPFLLGTNLAITIGLAVISWHCFEKPLNDLKRFFPYR